MVVQAIKDIRDALVVQIETEVSAFNLVTDDVRHSEGYGSSSYPVCVVRAGNRRHSAFVTSPESIDIDIFIRIVGSEKTTADELTDLYESTVDALDTDLTIDDTCIKSQYVNADPPMLWPQDQKFIMDAMITVTYWRDI